MTIDFYCPPLGKNIQIDVDYEIHHYEKETLEHPGCQGGIEITDLNLIMTDELAKSIKEYFEEELYENFYEEITKAIEEQ